MGASTIIDILNNPYLKSINKLIIQSNNDYEELRRSVVELGFIIIDEEFLIDNNKAYINIIFEKGNKDYTDEEYKYGPILVNDNQYIEYMINHYNSVLSYVPSDKIDVINDINKEIEMLNKYVSR